MLNLLIMKDLKSDSKELKNIFDNICNSNIKTIDLNNIKNDIRILLYSNNSLIIEEYIQEMFECNSEELHNEYINFIDSIYFSIITCIISIINEDETLKILFNNDIKLLHLLFNYKNSLNLSDNLKDLLLYINQCVLSINNKCFNTSNRIKTFIEENYMLNITINTIADKFNYTPNYISYIFKNTFKKNISDYISELKILKSKELLINMDTSIKTISETLGFSNTSYFCRVFKKYTLLTPKEYRNITNSSDKNI